MTATTQPGITLEEQIQRLEYELDFIPRAARRRDEISAAIGSLIRLREIEAILRDPSDEMIGAAIKATGDQLDFHFIFTAMSALLLRGKP